MAITFVQKAVSVDPTVASTTLTLNITTGGTGNLICGMVSWQAGTNLLTNVKDNNGVTYNIADTVLDSVNTTGSASFYLPNISGSPTSLVATFSSSVLARIQMTEWSGVATVTPLDGHVGANPTSAGTTVTSGSIATTANGDLLYTAVTVTNAGSVTFTAGTGTNVTTMTLRNAGTGGEIAYDESGIQNTSSATTTTTLTASQTGTVSLITIMAFKAAAGAANPTSQDDWPNPQRTPWYQHWQSTFEPAPTVLPVNLRVQLDWPNPTGPVYTDWYKFTDDTNTLLPIPTVLPTPLRKQVTASNPQPIVWYQSWIQNSIQSVPAPFKQLNWPLPQSVTWYQSWIETGTLPLPTPFFQNVNAPLPVISQPIDQTWIQSKVIFYQEETFPFNQDDWPNPQRIVWDRFWSQSPAQPVVGAPFVKSDWPLAQRIYWYLDPNIQNIIGTTLASVPVEVQFDWQLPGQINPLTPSWTYNQTILMGPVATPFFQTDWPLPRTYTPIPQSWTEFGNVQLPFPTPFFQNVDANTPVIVRPIDQTWIQSLVNFYQANTFPFHQSDYPNPYPVRWYVDYNQNLVIYLPVGIKPTNQSDWPLTGTFKPIDQFYSQSLALNLPTPPPPLVIFSSGRQLTERDVLRSWMSAIGDKGRAIRYSQIPNFPG